VGIRSMSQALETLSGGQRQCVAVARAAAFAKHVVIMDEPTAALGVKEGGMVLELIRRVRDRGLPVVLISHNMPHVFEVADRIHIRAAWHDIDIRARIAAMTGLPVEFAKDTTAACAAELVMGQGRGIHNFLYLFVGTFIGGGMVIDGRLHSGPHDNAGAVGSIPVAGAGRNDGQGGAKQPTRQLLHAASGFVLEQLLSDAGAPAAAAHDHRALSPEWWRVTEQWLDTACPAIAGALINATALLDLEAVVIDGELDRQLVREIIRRTERVLDGFVWEGMVRPQLLEGTIGADARAMGGAILPLYAHFAPVHELFLKPATEAGY
jgi:predicted NBD/HSP70 family sugar kinase